MCKYDSFQFYLWMGQKKDSRGVFLLRILYGCEIPRMAQIGNNVTFIHRGLGTVISSFAIIEDNVRIQHHVTIGTLDNGERKAPIIRRGAYIGAYAILLGDIEIGENAKIGAGTMVLHDVEANSTYVNPVDLKRLH